MSRIRKSLADSADADPDASAVLGGGSIAPLSVKRRRSNPGIESSASLWHSHVFNPDEFPRGAILRVALQNFMTYDFVEFYPGPGLNVVVGPNGSGKSSVVSAICLGLAGSTLAAGRSSNPKSYIKDGAEKATIEIELFSGSIEVANCVIRRIMTATNSSNRSTSVWFLNGRKVSEGEIEKTVAGFNIQVDNLCQFLAQERVASFTGLDSKMLLEETQKAISKSELYDMHQKLIESGRKDQVMMVQLKEVEEEKTRLEQKLQRLESEVERFRTKQDLLTKKQLLEKKKLWIQVGKLLEEKDNKFDVVKSIEKELESFNEITNPYNHLIAELEQEMGSFTRLNRIQTDIGSSIVEIEKAMEEYELYGEKMAEASRDLRAEKDEILKRQKQLQAMIDEVHRMEEELSHYHDSSNTVEEMKDLQNQKNSKVSRLESLNDQLQSINSEIRDQERNVNFSEKELRRIQDVRLNRLKTLFNRNASQGRILQEIVQFVQNSRKESKFRGRVLGPLICEINVEDSMCAAYVENQVGKKLQTAFLVENDQDYDLLNRQFGNRITVVSPPATKNYSRLRLSDIWTGLKHLEDAVDGEDVVKNVLKSWRNLHLQAYTLDRALDESRILAKTKNQVNDGTGLAYLYSADNYYTVTFSNYSNASSTRVDKVRKAQILVDSTNNIDKSHHLDVLKRSRAAIDQLNERSFEIQKEVRHIQGEIDAIQRQIQEVKARDRQQRNLRSKIQGRRLSIKELESQEVVPEEMLNASHKRRMQEFLRMKERESRKLVASLEILQDLEMTSIEKIRKVHCAEQLRALTRASDGYTALLNQLQSRLKEARRIAKDAERAYLQLQAKALNIAPPKECQHLFAEYEIPNDVDEVNRMLIEADAQMSAIQADADSIQRYEMLKSSLEERTAAFEQLLSNRRESNSSLGALKERWLKLLCEKVAIIDKAYASLFSKMNCEGAVRVKESEDYADWGLEILVKFRNTSELKPLSKESNSGGERSVSTMLYLLGLQAVTDVPFRVVDEINQGMDAVNERMIFDRIVEQSNECSGISNDSSKKPPQYFLITPKLLPNLNYEASEKITILNVFNGFWNLPTEVLDLRKFI